MLGGGDLRLNRAPVYNLSYVSFDDDGIDTGSPSHELGHAMGLVHGPNKYSCPAQPRVMNYGCEGLGFTSPTSYDAADVVGMYAP